MTGLASGVGLAMAKFVVNTDVRLCVALFFEPFML